MTEGFPVNMPQEEIKDAPLVLANDASMMVEYYHEQIRFVKSILRRDVDYGKIPGTNKDTLYKPGAEKFQRFNGFATTTELAEHQELWDIPITLETFPLFTYRYTTKVFDRTGLLLNTCDGSTNSFEDRYRWRWVQEHEVPVKFQDWDIINTKDTSATEFVFALEKRETTGKWGKPEEYWANLDRLVQEHKYEIEQRKTSMGMSDCYVFSSTLYQVPNERIFDQVNTLQKMAIKRSYVGAIMVASMASEFFTQDLEDLGPQTGAEEPSLYTYVPDKATAARELIKYAASKGIDDAGNWIKALLDDKEIEWSLENWNLILKAVDEATDK